MAVYKSGGRYYGKVIFHGKVYRLPVSYTNKQKADAAVKLFKAELQNKDRLIKTRGQEDNLCAVCPIDKLVQTMFSFGTLSRPRESTILAYMKFEKSLSTFFKTVHPEIKNPMFKNLNYLVMDEYIAWLKNTNHRINGIISKVQFLHRVFREFKKKSNDPFFDKDFFADINLGKSEDTKKRPFTDEEINKIFAYMEKRKNVYSELRFLALVSLKTALRISDCRALKWSEVDFDKREISKGKQIKTDEPVTVPIVDDLYEELLKRKEALQRKPEKEISDIEREYVCVYGIERTAKELSNSFSRIIKRVGLNSKNEDGRNVLSFHSLRHTCLTRLAKVGSLSVVKKVSGHKSTAMLERYVNPNLDDVRKLMRESSKAEQNGVASGSSSSVVMIPNSLLNEIERLTGGKSVVEILQQFVAVKKFGAKNAHAYEDADALEVCNASERKRRKEDDGDVHIVTPEML